MNRLSIVLIIAFVSYSLCAPENIESHSGDINHAIEPSSDQELEKQNGYGDGNVNSDPSASENPIDEFVSKKRKGKPVVKTGGGYRPGSREAICFAICTASCVSGSETSACLLCMSGCLR